MNYLGHIYLSGFNEPLLVGNFIGDYVKGKRFMAYPDAIRRGILYHRAIDHYTDQNRHWQSVRELLRPLYGRYAGVVADVFTDHFLAANWQQFSEVPLSWQAKWAYAALLKHYDQLPHRVQGFLPYLIQHRRLQSYATFEGIEVSLAIMSKYTSLPDNTSRAMLLLHDDYQPLKKHATSFVAAISRYRDELLNIASAIK